MTPANPTYSVVRVVDEDFQGRTTIVTVAPMADERALGLQLPRPDARPLEEGLVGIGISRCRPEDHYDRDLGLAIATARAVADLAAGTVARAAAMSITEEQYLWSRMSALIESLRGIGR